jgi:hypothetical protein
MEHTMTDKTRLRKIVEEARFSLQQITANVRQIHGSVLVESPYLDTPNFTTFHPDDLKRLFEKYDHLFFEGLCRKLLGQTELCFRISRRMTQVGGKTTRFVWRNEPAERYYEITLSSTLLFQTFHDVKRPITVTGLECRNRLEALQRIFEHELIHLIELLLWDQSRCSAPRFQSMSSRFFGHTDHRHQLVTPQERALTKFGIRPGSRVRFRFDGTEHVGVVNRITNRATVLVENKQGSRYSDGKRYAKFYIPVGMLEPLE